MSSGPGLEGIEQGPGRQWNSSTQEMSQHAKRMMNRSAPILQGRLLVSMTWAYPSFLQNSAGSIPLWDQRTYMFKAILKN